MVTRQRAAVLGVAEGEQAAIARHDQIAAAVWREHHPHHVRDVSTHAGDRPVVMGVPEGEQSPVGTNHPVAVVVLCGCHADDVRDVVADAGHRAVVLRIAKREDTAVAGDHHVTVKQRRAGRAVLQAGRRRSLAVGCDRSLARVRDPGFGRRRRDRVGGGEGGRGEGRQHEGSDHHAQQAPDCQPGARRVVPSYPHEVMPAGIGRNSALKYAINHGRCHGENVHSADTHIPLESATRSAAFFEAR